MAKKPKIVTWGILTGLTSVLTIGSIVGNVFANRYATTINVALDTSYSKVVGYDENSMYFTSDFENEDARWEYERELCAQLEAEGAALLKNDNSALPLGSGAKVSLFARGSVELVYGGTGSGSVDTSAAPTLKEALTNEGISVNETLWSWYESTSEKYGRVTPASISDALAANTQYAVNEAPWSEVESANASSFAEYGDAAIVVLSRSGGEGADLPDGDSSVSLETNTNAGGLNASGEKEQVAENVDTVLYGVGAEGDGDYLALSQEEKDLLAGLKALKDDGTFKKIVVLLNTSNALELDFLNPEICGADYGIDSCMWIGDVGQTGAIGVGRLLSGSIAPSGSIVDTFWYDNMKNPAVVNFYTVPYAGYEQYGLALEGADVQGMYSVYQEGIYLGYRYAETRYEDVVMGTEKAGDFDYASTVAYPFGYGMSYTTFDFSDFTFTEGADAFTVSVNVTNTGDAAAKKTVQIYFQSPYTDYDKQNAIEKASVELCGFDKTEVLEPGASEKVTIEIPKTELRAYDANGAKGYILDAGDYYFTAANGSHEAVNNILAAKGFGSANGMTADGNADLVGKFTQAELDTQIFRNSAATGNEITNLFDESDPNKSSLTPGTVTFLTRSDWEGTFPTARQALTMNDELANALAFTQYKAEEHADTAMPTLASGGDMSISEMIGAEYDDERWEALLDQLTFEEMVNTITLGFHNTAACETVSKAATKDENGPQGLTASLTGGKSAMCYTSEDVMAATMNTELMEDVGRCIGNDCLDMGYSGLYGPGINMHRTPYSGRNFEYYSEDPFVAGTICTAETKGIQSKGVYVYLKHVALNDSESSRRGVNTWLTEQTAREIYLEVADKAIIDGGAWCVMSGFNRWGAQWCGENANLMNGYLRGEAGMRGMSITDFSGLSQYMDVADGLIGGSDIWDSPMPMIHTAAAGQMAGDPYMVTEMREAMHRILYTVANSNAMNGWNSETHIEPNTPWWQLAIYGLIGVSALLTVLSVFMLVKNIKLKKSQQ
ncbi:MAG: glycoside hydrolase family 3 C-terminal domain-containing protein [Lachnospiraceae bacterium]|nr:glycoside hydrolase family 3 C-terminal domain-containing protein [Lachnospiraceae bacterium]